MRSYLLPAILVAAIGIAPMAFASRAIEGVVKAVDMKTHTLTLDDGVTYVIPAEMHQPVLKPGEKVKITWDLRNTDREITEVQVIK